MTPLRRHVPRVARPAMIKNTLAIILLTAAASLAQTGFSESKSYKPRDVAKIDADKNTTLVTPPLQDVAIPVSVVDAKGIPVTDLAQSNFTVFVDGVEAKVTGFNKAAEFPNVILLLDMSPSAHRRIETIRDQAAAFVEDLPAGAKVMVADFNSQMNIRTQLTADRKSILDGIDGTKVGDGTSLYSAIHTLFEKVIPTIPGRKVVVLFTDGVDTTSTKSSAARSLHEVEKRDVSIYTVFHDTLKDFPQPGASIGPLGGRPRSGRPSGFPLPPGVLIGRGRTPGSYEKEYEAGRNYLADLASSTGGRVVETDKFQTTIQPLVAELSARYTVTVSVPANGSAASRPLKVRVNRGDLNVVARGSFIE